MSLLQISEPNQSRNPHEHKFALGIDLGTTRSLVAVVRSGKASVLEAENITDTLLPSVVYYPQIQNDESSSPIVGQSALDKFHKDPKNTIVSAKRFMGRSLRDIKFSHPYELSVSNNSNASTMPAFVTSQGDKTPVEVSADILKALIQRATQALPDDSIQGAVITVPAYFDEAQRQATKDAAKVAGINVLRLLNEPTAAAVAYGLDAQDNHATSTLDDIKAKHYLIYDLGGGTFDVSILKLSDDVFEVLATGGNTALGGDDIDRLLANWLLQQSGTDPKLANALVKSQLTGLARSYKEQLSDQSFIKIDFNTDDISISSNWSGKLDSDTLSTIIQPVSKRTLSICEQVLRDANLKKTDIDEVVLVGGSTRMPVIQSLVESFFDISPLCSINPDQVVALGAAQTADKLVNNSDENSLLLLDVTPLSLGLETMGGLVEVLIPRNTPIPVNKRQVFTTYQDGQTGMVIHVLQGERDTVDNNRSLGKFVLNGIPPMKAGLARIEVTFSVNVDGQLTVTAMENTTGTQSQINIVPSYGLSDEQKERLLVAGFTHANEDKSARQLIETKVEANRELLALESALAEFSSILTDEEQDKLQTKMKSLKLAIQSAESTQTSSSDQVRIALQQIVEAQAELKPISDNFASVIMNTSIQQSMAGTTTKVWQ